jgi:hypothetical protein
MEPCKWAMYTVPHSGTRYIADAFALAGHEMMQCMPRGPNLISGAPNGLMWAHWLVHGKNPHKYDTVPVDSAFSVVRDPVMTWATHGRFLLNEELSPERKYGAGEDKKISIQQQYDYQNKFADRVSHWHRVDKDSLESLGKWAGVELCASAPSHSRPTALKQAVIDRDVEKIKELAAPTDFWEWFVNDLTPRFAERYEAMGYDLWWKNG